ncbi:GntR family transcriptional regulator [Actinoplanes sp. OR16]|uniref:GntR family transcriptional regulator n=1 Tax=Actinoplanes sp. OR16 TaxID=946334 RepID=UPI000F6F9A49|nr:GntR family transcriptional regulator [Actinoplanes sp. OR16]BBH68175.1 GntR family transcriptional regulator [Actinoplanes sp. OR16]
MSSLLSKHESVYRSIRERILGGTYGPGERLVLSAIARDLDVSPVPVREAMRRLEAENLITFERNVGARVNTLDDEAWEQLVEMLALLDGYAMRRAQCRITPAAIGEAQRLNDALRAHAGGPADQHGEVMALHRLFHRILYAAGDNRYLIESLDSAWDRIDASRVLASRWPAHRLVSSVDEHDQLLRMLRSGDVAGDELERCTRQHSLNAIIAIRGRRTPGQLDRAVLPGLP